VGYGMKEQTVNRFVGYILAVFIGCAITTYVLQDKQDGIVTTRHSVMREDEVIEI
jgi:hypothetical protein